MQFRIHYDGTSMILEPHESRTFTTIRVPKNIYTEKGNMEVHSKGLCRLLANKLKWDINCSYRIPGKLIPQQQIVIFDLSKASVIPQSSSYNPELYFRNE